MSDPVITEGAALRGSRDPATGQVYFPERALSADGRLTPCEPIELSREGVLYSWTRMGGRDYGQIDLPEKVRLHCPLGPGNHDIGARYRLEYVSAGDAPPIWRFARA